MTAADIPACDALRSLAGWNQTVADWELLLTAQPKGCFVIEDQGRVVGSVASIGYGRELAWIGMMLVHPQERRRGLGRTLMEHCLAYLDALGVKCIKLDATPAGQPLYEQLGFASEWTLTRWASTTNSLPLLKTAAACRDCSTADLPRMIELDAQAFGVRRDDLLRELVLRSTRAIVAEVGEEMAGFALLRPGSSAPYLGPVVATSSHAAQLLVNDLQTTPGLANAFWDIPDGNSEAAKLAEQFGFVRCRALTRMSRGARGVIQRAELIFGIADPALG